MSITRRVFLRNSALAVVGTTAIPSFLTRAAFGSTEPGARPKRLVVIFQRGAADGLNIVVPHGRRAYYAMRPSINIPRKDVLDLDGLFGLHPALASLQPLWDEGDLAIVHACGSPDTTRSHFDAQDYMESGTPGVKSTPDGWLAAAARCRASSAFSPSVLSRWARGLPRILRGDGARMRDEHVAEFDVRPTKPGGARCARVRVDVRARRARPAPWHRAARLRGGEDAEGRAPARYTAAPTARTIRAAASARASGRSPSSSRPTSGCRLRSPRSAAGTPTSPRATSEASCNAAPRLPAALAAFWTDLGDRMARRRGPHHVRVRPHGAENGNRGTDHGQPNVMFVMGGPVKGGKVYGKWPGLEQSQLYEGRDLAVTTDFRRVLGEAVARAPVLGNTQLDQVFPEFENQSGRFLRYLGWPAIDLKAAASRLDVDQQVAILDFQGVHDQLRGGVVDGLPGWIPCPAVPWADDFPPSLNDALTQRSAAMQADVVDDRRDRAVCIGNTNHLVATGKLFHLVLPGSSDWVAIFTKAIAVAQPFHEQQADPFHDG